jgi:ubiquinone/menaquinone biosynthesis C-methylase UbiE
MTREESTRVCPASRAGALDFWLRRWLQNPHRILRPYVREGMTVLDFGCGPGFFTIALAEMVGASGRVIAADLQDEMLRRLGAKLERLGLSKRVSPHKCASQSLGLTEKVDFVVAFYVVHELPDRAGFFQELSSALKPAGSVLVVEPPFHVSAAAFRETVGVAESAGFRCEEGPHVLFSKSALLKRG